MKRYLPLTVTLLVLIVGAMVQGKWTERWMTFPELQVFADQLQEVPLKIGQWEGTEGKEMDEQIRKAAGAVGSLSRTYVNERKQPVSVFIVCGRLLDVFAHTPKQCYPAAGFEMLAPETHQSLDLPSGKADFFTTTFSKSTEKGNESLRIYWSWNADGTWIAPDEGTSAFIGHRAIYKLYVSTPMTSEQTATENAAIAFARECLPEIEKTLAPAIAKAAASRAENK